MSVRKFSTASILSPSHKGNKLWDQTTFQSGMFAIATISLTSSQSSVSFTDIPANYTHLQLRVLARSDRASNPTSNVQMTFNGSTASNYADHDVTGNGSTATGEAGTSKANIAMQRIPGATGTASVFGAVVADILDYSSTTKNKTVRWFGGCDLNGSGEIYFGSGLWYISPIAAITSITLKTFDGNANFLANSHFALYGIKAA